MNTKPRGRIMNKKIEKTNALVKANPTTSPPLELLLQKAREEEQVRPPIHEYEPVIKVLVAEKKYTAAMVREWLSDHGAGNYGQATVATAVTVFGKKWKAEQAEENKDDD